MKKLVPFIFLILISITFSQESLDTISGEMMVADSLIVDSVEQINLYNPLLPPNTYTDINNPNYWKNKMPHPGYWQQDVHYQISAEIIDTENLIKGHEILTYTNNSPDELNYVFFHLYQNAFEPESYLDKFRTANKMESIYRPDELKQKGTEILSVKSNDEVLDIEIDNTIMKVFLKEPLKSGESIVLDIVFDTYFGGNEEEGNVRRRMKVYEEFGKKHYNGVHWYPRISVYDRKFGWTTDQHLGKEFYGDFGCFDVELTFPENYIVEATGFMVNRDELLPKELMKKLDIKNFAHKKYNSPPSTIITYNPNKKKTWNFHAENVHDFSFTADPSYRIGVTDWNGIKSYSLAQEQHASKWQNASDYASRIIEVFSEDFGMYQYHKIIVADARSGMEYPMITLDRGKDPGYRGLLIHEIAHMWFFGQVGNNETYRAALDEGFTQFLTAWGTEILEGEYMERDLTYVNDSILDNENTDILARIAWLKNNKSPLNKYYDAHTNQLNAKDDDVFYRYIMDATDNNTPQLNTHSHDFGGSLAHRGSYTHVYGKTAAMLYNLQYVLGDDLFLAAMQNYFHTWKMAHPYLNDFRNSIIHFTKVDLNWFFDQWLDTNKDIDYSIKKVKKLRNDTIEVTIERKGEMQMPIDLTIDSKFGLRYHYHIPNTWFKKEDKERDYLLKRWIGYGNLQKEYTFKQQVPSGVKNIMIDVSGRLADSYMIDNNYRGNMHLDVDWGVKKYANLRKYEVLVRPDIWYNAFDGVKIGPNIRGHYLNKHHVFQANLWTNTGYGRNTDEEDLNENNAFSYRVNYSHSLNKYVKNSKIRFSTSYLDGLKHSSLGYNIKDINGMNNIDISMNSFLRQDDNDLDYLIGENTWQEAGKRNTNITIQTSHRYKYLFPLQSNNFHGTGKISLSLRSSSILSDYNFSTISLSVVNKNHFKDFKINTRMFVQAGFNHGSASNFPYESMLYASGANPETMMENKYARSAGFIPDDWGGGNALYDGNTYFHYGGGLNLRGYSGRKMKELVSDVGPNPDNELFYRGTSGISFNTEIDFTHLIPRLHYFGLNSYVFTDIGMIGKKTSDNENFLTSDIYIDSGIGFTWEVSRLWSRQINAKPLVLRFDLPFYLNEPLDSEEMLSFNRFIFGINRAF